MRLVYLFEHYFAFVYHTASASSLTGSELSMVDSQYMEPVNTLRGISCLVKYRHVRPRVIGTLRDTNDDISSYGRGLPRAH